MKISNHFAPALFTVLGLTLACAPQPAGESAGAADTVYTNGKIYTVNEAQPWAEAVAIKDGKFLVVGSAADVEAVTGDSTEVVDLGGKFAMPGIQDTHLHFESAYLAGMLEGKMLKFTEEQKSIEDLQAALKEYADANPDLEVLFAEQLQADFFPNLTPTKSFVDDVIPDRPVVIMTSTEHEALLNTKAMEMEGITAATPAPQYGEIVRDPGTGEPVGYLKESAAGKWGVKHYPPLERDLHKQGLEAVIEYLNSIGITSGKQQHAKPPVATAFKDLSDAEELTMRVALSWTYKGPLEPMPMEEQERTLAERQRFASELIDVDFVKLSSDGVVGATGWVLAPYHGTGETGLSFNSLENMTADIARFDAMGMGVTVHAMGDAAARQMIDALEAAKEKNGALKARHQLGHASLIHPDDLPRLKEVDLTSEFSPVLWFPNGMVEGYSAPLGPERVEKLWPMQSVLQAGGRINIATDGPLFWREPMETLESAVTRRVPGGESDVLGPNEAIDLATGIRAMTLDAAYLMNQDDMTGSIEVGKYADMIVLDKNLFDIPETAIGASKVLMTVFDGKVVFDVANDPAGQDAIEDAHGVELDLSGEAASMGSEWHRD
jgi:predicted amidohydrolase YtcJ